MKNKQMEIVKSAIAELIELRDSGEVPEDKNFAFLVLGMHVFVPLFE